MMYIAKSPEPQAFIAWKEAHREHIEGLNTAKKRWNYIGKQRNYHIKVLLKQSLYVEQKGLCVYCNDRISLTQLEKADGGISIQRLREEGKILEFIKNHTLGIGQIDELSAEEKDIYFTIINRHLTVVEHIVAKSPLKNPDVTFDYHNIALSCNGNKEEKQYRESDTFCDLKKGGNNIEVLPTDLDCEQQFTFDSESGEIRGKTPPATRTIGVLGLNCRWLLIRRLAIIRSMFYSDDILQPVLIENSDLIRERWARLLHQQPEGHLPAFWSALNFIKQNEYPGLD